MACKLEEAVQEINKLLTLPAVNKEKTMVNKLNLAKQSIEAQMKLLGTQSKLDTGTYEKSNASGVITVYHGTNIPIKSFDKSKAGGARDSKLGHFFTDSLETAIYYGVLKKYPELATNEVAQEDIIKEVMKDPFNYQKHGIYIVSANINIDNSAEADREGKQKDFTAEAAKEKETALNKYDVLIDKNVIDGNGLSNTYLVRDIKNIDILDNKKVNISSGTKGLPGALTNHTILSKKKGSIESDYPIEFNGTKYDSVESAYQDNKVDESTTKPVKSESKNYKLMVELISEKFANHPRLASAVTKLGGLKYLENAVHQPTSKNTVWETGGQDWFMSAMKDAYTDAIAEPVDIVEQVEESVDVVEDGLTDALFEKLLNTEDNGKKWSLILNSIILNDSLSDEEYDAALDRKTELKAKLRRLGLDPDKGSVLSKGKLEKLFDKSKDFVLNEGQKKAVEELTEFINNSSETTHVLKGRGGTGKTTIVNKVLELANLTPDAVFFTTISHKAKQVIEGANKDSLYSMSTYAVTESSLFPMTFRGNKTNKLIRSKAKVIVVDEASMVSTAVLKEIEKSAIAMRAKVIYMGDNVQLPPVNEAPGKPSPVFNTKNYPNVSELITRMRQGVESPILPITDVLASFVEGTSNSLYFDGKSTNNTNGEVKYVDYSENVVDEFIVDFKKDPQSTRYVWYNNSVHPKTVSLVNNIRTKLYGANAAKEAYVEGEQIILNDNYGDLERGDWKGFNSSEYTVQKVEESPKTSIDWGVYINGDRKHLQETYDRPVYTILAKSNIDESLVRLVAPVEDFASAVKHLENTIRKNNPKETDANIRAFSKKAAKELSNISYGYVISSHKSQGSTYKTVYTDVENILNAPRSNPIDQAKSLYVATSRPTDKLVMINAKNFIDSSRKTKQEIDIIEPSKAFEKNVNNTIKC